MNRITLAALAAAASITAVAQNVQQVNIGDNFNYGITYSLPTTAVRIAITAHCTQTVAGPFAPYAEKFLGLKDVAQADMTHYEITEIHIDGVGHPDSTRTYHIDFSEKGALPTFYLTDELCLWTINREPEVPATEVPAADTKGSPIKYKPTDVMTSDMLKAGSKSKQAELCADEIFSIRESRSELVRGEADNTPNDGKQLQLMLDNLTAQEEALLSLFVGNTTERDVTNYVEYIPTGEADHVLAFRYSSDLGLVGNDDLAGAPYYLSISITEDNRMSEADVKAHKKLEKGIAHCVPGKARVTLSTASDKLAEGIIALAQLGHVEQLPQLQFTDKKKPCSAVFVPATGAIRLFNASGE